jgi:hypothetical protein
MELAGAFFHYRVKLRPILLWFDSAKGISRQKSGTTNAGRQVSVWSCASACVRRLITGHWPSRYYSSRFPSRLVLIGR